MVKSDEKAGFFGIAAAVCLYVIMIVIITKAILFIGNVLG